MCVFVDGFLHFQVFSPALRVIQASLCVSTDNILNQIIVISPDVQEIYMRYGPQGSSDLGFTNVDAALFDLVVWGPGSFIMSDSESSIYVLRREDGFVRNQSTSFLVNDYTADQFHFGYVYGKE